MTLSLQVSIFQNALNYNFLTMRGSYPALSYDIQMDGLSNATSTISISDNGTTQVGDYVAIKIANTTKVIYYGQVTAIDFSQDTNTTSLTACYIWNLLNGEIIVNNKSGNSYEQHLIAMIKNYFSASPNTNPLNSVFQPIINSTNTPFAITSSDGTQTSNFVDYLIRGFKLHNVVMSVTGFTTKIFSGLTQSYPIIDIHQETETMTFKNNIYDFQGWTVTDTRGLRGYNNELWIVDKASSNMESPSVLARYWLQKDGSVVKNLNSNVAQPTQVHVYLYDKTATDNPTNDSIAQTELSGNGYNHHIQFSMPLNNNFMPLDKVKLGLQSNIYYNQKLYKSVLSGYSLSSDSDNISLTFGNLRFGRNDLFGTDK